MVHVSKQNRENVNGLIRRFSMRVREAGIIHEVRAQRFRNKKKSKRKLKDAALWRNEVVDIKRKLIKLGEIERTQKVDPERLRKMKQDNR